jgi:hypothetical protein
MTGTRIPGEPAEGTAFDPGYTATDLDSPYTVEDASNFTTDGFDNGVVVSYPDNYTVCDRSGFRVLPEEIVRNWDGLWTRQASFDHRHPMDFLRPRTESQRKGSENPEEQMSETTYLTTNEVGVDDL